MPDCPKCGRSNPTDTPLCGNCGANLPKESPADEAADVPEQMPEESDNEVLRFLRAGQKISAIKVYREQTGVGLKEAKDAVEALAAEHDIAPKASGCAAGAVLLALLIGGGLAACIALTPAALY